MMQPNAWVHVEYDAQQGVLRLPTTAGELMFYVHGLITDRGPAVALERAERVIDRLVGLQP